MRIAAVYRRKGMLILHPYARSVTGVRLLTEPVNILEATVDAATIGQAIRDTLAASRGNVAPPADWSSVLAPLLQVANVKSWSVFVQGALLCEVEDDGANIKIAPRVNHGAREGFRPLDTPPIVVASSAPVTEIGAALMRALEVAQ